MAENNRITITTESEEQARKILDVLNEAEEENEIDFTFETVLTDYPR